jgi:hypothetical protein
MIRRGPSRLLCQDVHNLVSSNQPALEVIFPEDQSDSRVVGLLESRLWIPSSVTAPMKCHFGSGKRWILRITRYLGGFDLQRSILDYLASTIGVGDDCPKILFTILPQELVDTGSSSRPQKSLD